LHGSAKRSPTKNRRRRSSGTAPPLPLITSGQRCFWPRSPATLFIRSSP
jgi:hypothetical protein